MGILDRFKHSWNAFFGKGPPYDTMKVYTPPSRMDLGYSSSYRPDRVYFTKGQEKNLISSIYNRIAVDVSSVDFRHVVIDENNRFVAEKNSTLNRCLWLEANKDQTARAFIQDIVLSMFDEGCVAVVPIDTDIDPNRTDSYDIETMRVCRITQWFPDHIRVEAYNDKIGQKQEIVVEKRVAAIIENPFYSMMNEPNSVGQRLMQKLNLLDVIDNQSSSGKFNMIIQLPYIIKTEARRKQAEERRQDIENQLASSKYGIAYTDGTEKVTQLNRPLENNVLAQVEYLTSMLYSQLGIDESVLKGTADEKTMLNYKNNTIIPISNAIAEELTRKCLTKTAISQKQRIMYFSNPFKLVPVSNLADIADKFTRNEIMSSNEIRQIIGLKPSDDPEADELRNKNLKTAGPEMSQLVPGQEVEDDSEPEGLLPSDY